MFCPKCKYEYLEGIKKCPDCKVPLVDKLPPEPQLEYVELVTVFETGNKAIIAVAKSILEDAEIKYFVKGEGIQDLFALGSFGIGSNPLIGPVKIQVRREDEEDAKNLLKDLRE